MARIVLITGGSRSGKSAYAQKMAEALPGPRAFVATCPVLDDEMRARVEKHRAARSKAEWQTIEEQTDLAGVVRRAQSNVLLIDCMTLWVNNVVYQAESEKRLVSEEEISDRCREILAAAAQFSGTIIFVTNEVGMGIIPDNALARRFRDLAGRCNQVLAQGADSVVVVISGLPLVLKTPALQHI